MTKPNYPHYLREYFRHEGRKGAEIHRISPQAAALGVAVRKAKAVFIRQGFQPQEALRRARIRVKGGTP